MSDYTLDEATQYARAYWTHGQDPETQAALTLLAQAVESMREFMKTRTLDGEFTELERWEEQQARRRQQHEAALRHLGKLPPVPLDVDTNFP